MFIRKASDGDEGGQQLLWEGRLLFEQIDKASLISVGSAERDEIIRDLVTPHWNAQTAASLHPGPPVWENNCIEVC